MPRPSIPGREWPNRALAEVFDNDLGLLLDVVRMQTHELGQRARPSSWQVRVVLGRLPQPVVGIVGRVVPRPRTTAGRGWCPGGGCRKIPVLP